MNFRKRYMLDQILDRLLSGKIDDCLECGKFRRIMGRGLCKHCYLNKRIRSGYARQWTNFRASLYAGIEEQRLRFEELGVAAYKKPFSLLKDYYMHELEKRLWPKENPSPSIAESNGRSEW
jgi:hypothetical protein